MQTVLRGKAAEVAIDPAGPTVIIGESINPTRRQKLSEALEKRDFAYVLQLARRQIEDGADVLDVNVGVPGLDEVSLLPQVVMALAEHVDAPLCLDSPNPQALAAGLAVAPGRPLVNSVNGEEAALSAILPLVKEHGVAVIGLTLDDDGIPMDPQKRLAIAGRIIERAARLGIPAEDVIIDPLVMAVGADHDAARITLETIRLLRQTFNVNVALGASNVSFGLPDREVLNMAFLAMAIGAGATCVITNPARLASTVRAADLLAGRDEFATRYIAHFRARQKRQ